jgi:hypothetical protein
MRIFFHRAILSCWETGRSHRPQRGVNLENTVDAAAIRSPIPPISLRQQGISVPAHWLGGTVLSSSPSGAVFASMHRQICPIIVYNTAL